MEFIQGIMNQKKLQLNSRELAETLDKLDPLKQVRQEFHIPYHPEDPTKDSIYLCGNSLGLQPIRTATLIQEELDVWRTHGVRGHFDHPHERPWADITETVVSKCAKIVGADPEEVAVMATLTMNIHLMMVRFYSPTAKRHKILMERGAFPSDSYAINSQIEFHGYKPEESVVFVEPRIGEFMIRTEDILATIDKNNEELALVFLPGVQYYSGQVFEIKRITEYVKIEKKYTKICVGWDLAHAVGNIELQLTEWGVDFACWCSYKYLNSGPGGVAGLFVHKNNFANNVKSFAGWWGNNPKTKFEMSATFDPIVGAGRYQVSNAAVMSIICLLGSLEMFDKIGMEQLRKKSKQMTGYLHHLLTDGRHPETGNYEIITTDNEDERGCQISIKLKQRAGDNNGRDPVWKADGSFANSVFSKLERRGVIVDKRNPDVIRVSPVPMYNRFVDCFEFATIFKEIMKEY